jgi:hypothetical protein
VQAGDTGATVQQCRNVASHCQAEQQPQILLDYDRRLARVISASTYSILYVGMSHHRKHQAQQ